MNLFKICFILINFKLNYEIVNGFCSSSLAKTYEYESNSGLHGAAAGNRTWDNGIVFYTISDEFTESEVNTIKDAMKTIEEKTKLSDKKCIQFKERTNEPDYVIIQDGNGCSSMIGRSLSQPQYLNLSRSRSCLLNEHNVNGSLVIHELVHVLGFNHEHTRPDRNESVNVNYKNINPNNMKDFEIEKNFFDLNTSYDLKSIMHYPSISAACINNEINAIESINEPKTIPNNVVLSEIDIREILMLYKCRLEIEHLAEIVRKKYITCDSGKIKHTIKRGDTCLKLKLNMDIIAKHNLDCSYLEIGQEICLPKKQGCDGYKCPGGCDCSWVDNWPTGCCDYRNDGSCCFNYCCGCINC